MAQSDDGPTPDAREYQASDWLVYGDVANPSTKEKMILLAIENIIASGPADFNAMDVCDRLGINHSLVNYHFGNRDGLIAEATIWTHRQWTKNYVGIIRSAPPQGKKQLLASIEGEIAWAKKMGGMAVLVNYPITSLGSHNIVVAKYADELQKTLEFHLALVTTIVQSIRSGKVLPLDFTVENYPRRGLLRQSTTILAAASIVWSTHGIATWSSGQNVSSDGIDDTVVTSLLTKRAVKNHIQQIMKVAVGP
jgi:AcrR family transcriptional regulator